VTASVVFWRVKNHIVKILVVDLTDMLNPAENARERQKAVKCVQASDKGGQTHH